MSIIYRARIKNLIDAPTVAVHRNDCGKFVHFKFENAFAQKVGKRDALAFFNFASVQRPSPAYRRKIYGNVLFKRRFNFA